MKKRTRLHKLILTTAGIVATTLGIFGIILPLLPSTVFFLLAAAAFAHSSERMYTWLMEHKIFGALIRNYRLHHAISLRAKISALFFLWVSILYSAFGVVNLGWLRVLLLAIASGVSIHILSLKTLTSELPHHPKEAAQGESLSESAG